MLTTAFTRKDAKALLDTLAHNAKTYVMRDGDIEGRSTKPVVNNDYGFTRIIECYYVKKARFSISGCSYSRTELEDLLVDCYSY